MNSHEQSWLSIDEIGGVIPPYLPNFDFSSSFIDGTHQAVAEAPLKDDILVQLRNRPSKHYGIGAAPPQDGFLGQLRRLFKSDSQPTNGEEVDSAGDIIPGWLRREDALKLYELTYFSDGDILELGSFHGLSTSILANACRNSSSPKHIDTIDLDPSCTTAAKANLESLGLLDYVTIQTGDATVAVKNYIEAGKKFGFIFIDHSHEYQPCLDVCKMLDEVTMPGGFCLFHDFNDSRNRDPEDTDYGVYQAVQDGLNHEKFEFYGIYGCTGLYRRV